MKYKKWLVICLVQPKSFVLWFLAIFYFKNLKILGFFKPIFQLWNFIRTVLRIIFFRDWC